MTFSEYEQRAMALAFYPNRGSNPFYPVLGLCGESGEVAEKLKKIQRDKGGVVSDSDRELMRGEIGDVLWYCTAVAGEFGLTLEEVAAANVAKLESRAERGKLSGSGDER